MRRSGSSRTRTGGQPNQKVRSSLRLAGKSGSATGGGGIARAPCIYCSAAWGISHLLTPLKSSRKRNSGCFSYSSQRPARAPRVEPRRARGRPHLQTAPKTRFHSPPGAPLLSSTSPVAPLAISDTPPAISNSFFQEKNSPTWGAQRSQPSRHPMNLIFPGY